MTGEGRPADALSALGNELRTSVVRTLADSDEPLSFSDLHGATGADTSAGFAYHLRQLTGRYVRETDAGYELTAAGRAVACHLASGTFTGGPDLGEVDLAAPCPFCGASALTLSEADGGAGVACDACEEVVSAVPVVPAGLTDQDSTERAAAVDAHHRHRVSLFAAGTCPECAGPVDAALATTGADDALRATFRCETCRHAATCSPTMTVLDHPAVVALHHRHGADIRERPVWRVRGEWRERVVSSDPPVVRVTARLDGDAVALYLDDALDVVHTERRHDDRPATAAS